MTRILKTIVLNDFNQTSNCSNILAQPEAHKPKDSFISTANPKAVVIEPLPQVAGLSQSELDYYEKAAASNPPRADQIIHVKSKKYSFNHSHEFAIADNFLWFRKKGNEQWQAFYFDGFERGEIPQAIDSDGANLIVIDQNRAVHYKKVLEEYRGSEVAASNNMDLKAAASMIAGQEYIAINQSRVNNWTDKWFSLPVLSTIANLFSGKRLVLPDNIKTVAISHRGRFNDYIEDHVGQRHPVNTGVTTLYALDNNGQDIYTYDPWSPQWSRARLSLPERQHSRFIAENISASASTIMAIGWEQDRSLGTEKIKIVTMLSDIDTGQDPFLRFGYRKDDNNPELRVMPFQADWQEHPITLNGLAMVSDNISIMQTGQGNLARQLRIDGYNEQGRPGYYTKSLADPAWIFIETTQTNPEARPLVQAKLPDFTTTVHDYLAYINDAPAYLRNFGQRSDHSQIELSIEDKNYQLDLYRRLTLASFLGLESYQYDLVLPQLDERLKRFFGDKTAIVVRVREKNGYISMKRMGLGLNAFSWKFSR